MSSKTKTVSVRLPNEVAEYYREHDLKGILLSLYELSKTCEVEQFVKNVTLRNVME